MERQTDQQHVGSVLLLEGIVPQHKEHCKGVKADYTLRYVAPKDNHAQQQQQARRASQDHLGQVPCSSLSPTSMLVPLEGVLMNALGPDLNVISKKGPPWADSNATTEPLQEEQQRPAACHNRSKQQQQQQRKGAQGQVPCQGSNN